jgi:hypothetical protein
MKVRAANTAQIEMTVGPSFCESSVADVVDISSTQLISKVETAEQSDNVFI